ncbi:hypothetical protein TEA_013069 [Camellia sinensis var. sinensis]|uniref:SPX domain-containing protein n=1 Tax=Camellia sinensis var. sinensis TaxID=542762 RepID=A0A4S4D4P4_CAMSN|nr:hypothetical protein TEA_013069 [Camellia sinensis var. sinensis]
MTNSSDTFINPPPAIRFLFFSQIAPTRTAHTPRREYELVYFRRLDEEFNKVVKFYKLKVEEGARSERWPESEGSVEISRLAAEVEASTAALYASIPSEVGANTNHRLRRLTTITAVPFVFLSYSRSIAMLSRRQAITGDLYINLRSVDLAAMDAIEEEESSNHGHSDESSDDKFFNENKSINQNAKQHKPKELQSPLPRPAPLEILNQVKMNNALKTPKSIIKGLPNVHNPKEIKFRRENLKKVEEQQRAFIEFHQKLWLLKSYRLENEHLNNVGKYRAFKLVPLPFNYNEDDDKDE